MIDLNMKNDFVNRGFRARSRVAGLRSEVRT